MIDIDKIKEWNEFGDSDDSYEVQAIVSKGDLLDIIEMLRQSEKDAARYRWLRGTADVDGAADLMISIIASDEWDSLIDGAMQCNK